MMLVRKCVGDVGASAEAHSLRGLLVELTGGDGKQGRLERLYSLRHGCAVPPPTERESLRSIYQHTSRLSPHRLCSRSARRGES